MNTTLHFVASDLRHLAAVKKSGTISCVIGKVGCTFCNVASFADEAQQHRSIAEQLAHQAKTSLSAWRTGWLSCGAAVL